MSFDSMRIVQSNNNLRKMVKDNREVKRRKWKKISVRKPARSAWSFHKHQPEQANRSTIAKLALNKIVNSWSNFDMVEPRWPGGKLLIPLHRYGILSNTSGTYLNIFYISHHSCFFDSCFVWWCVLMETVISLTISILLPSFNLSFLPAETTKMLLRFLKSNAKREPFFWLRYTAS